MHQWIYRWSACWSLYKMKVLASKVKAEGGKWKRREVKNDNAEVFLDSTSSVFRKSSVRVSVMKQGSVNSAGRSQHTFVSQPRGEAKILWWLKKSRVQCTPPRTRSPGSHPGATAGLSLKKAWCTPVGPPPKGGAVGVWCSREVLDDLLWDSAQETTALHFTVMLCCPKPRRWRQVQHRNSI